MPHYNTRRVEISLPSLGIHVPVANGGRTHGHRASISSASSSSRASVAPASPDAHPSKKMKRSHNEDAKSPSRSAGSFKRRAPSPDAMKMDTTPPPSPRSAHRRSIEEDAPIIKEIDLEGINDEIVEAVIVQLQATANRPHIVKELTAILMQTLEIVQKSANPCAIVSSRLSTYMKRPCWSALSPCPLGKELETVHPRRTYFYLTTCPHQPLPDNAAVSFPSRAVITPPLSTSPSGAGSDSAEDERRRELSPSPEVDLSSPEFDDLDDDVPMPTTPVGSFPSRLPSVALRVLRNTRGASPPLEKDEREFTQTAEGLQKRKLSGAMLSAEPFHHEMDVELRDESLFGGEPRTLAPPTTSHAAMVASPAMRPTFMLNLKRDSEIESWAKLESMLEWNRSPENIELEELDGLLTDF